MDWINTCLIIFSILFSLSVIFIVCIQFDLYFRRNRIVSKSLLNSQKNNNQSYFSWVLRNGFNIFKKPARILVNKISFFKTFTKSLCSFLESKNFNTEPVSVLSVIICFSVFSVLVFGLIFWSLFVGIAIWLLLMVSLFIFIKTFEEKTTKQLREQIPDTFRFMSSCFGAGLTIQQTFEEIVQDSKSKIKFIFKRCCQVFQTGGTISDGLKCLQNIKDLPELAFVSVALDVQHQTGGSMQPVIESAKDMAQSKLELCRMLDVKTAQAKLSARIIIILPFALISIFSIISPGFLNSFFSSFIGIILFLIACIMEGAGIILVRKMLEINL